jgi:hypothetical protein
MKGIHARAVRDLEADVKSDAGTCAFFTASLKDPEYGRCFRVGSITDLAGSFSAPSQADRCKYSVVEDRRALNVCDWD